MGQWPQWPLRAPQTQCLHWHIWQVCLQGSAGLLSLPRDSWHMGRSAWRAGLAQADSRKLARGGPCPVLRAGLGFAQTTCSLSTLPWHQVRWGTAWSHSEPDIHPWASYSSVSWGWGPGDLSCRWVCMLGAGMRVLGPGMGGEVSRERQSGFPRGATVQCSPAPASGLSAGVGGSRTNSRCPEPPHPPALPVKPTSLGPGPGQGYFLDERDRGQMLPQARVGRLAP